MIRRERDDAYLLFTQDDHARLSGELARCFGADAFDPPSPRDAVIEAISLHDRGWRLHDENPTLNAGGLPLHVFETPAEIATQVWTESVKHAGARGEYQGLLVSLHVMALASIAQGHLATPEQRIRQPRAVFELNKFQQNQIEAQENFRNAMGMGADGPLYHGLARPGTSGNEDLLRRNYHLLRAADGLSLALLCTMPPFDVIEDVEPRVGREPWNVRMKRGGEWTLRIDPWPFMNDEIEADVPYRAVPKRAFGDVEEFRGEYAAAAVQSIKVNVVRDLPR